MRAMPDISTVELSRTRLKLRDDLLFVPQRYGSETFYHLEVTTTSEYFRIGYAEYVFVSLLDGRTSFAEALAITSQQQKSSSLNQHQAMLVYSWLLDNGLASFSDAETSASGASSATRMAARPGAMLKKLNPLWLRIPLGRPEVLLKAMHPVCGWLFCGPAMCMAVILILSAGLTLRAQWEQFSDASASVIARDNWLWLLGAWVGLKGVHELAHGLVCRRYGGSIRETGIILAFFTPMAYVDASSSWSFRSRWQRIHTAVAGVYVELLLASVAVIAWTSSESPLVRHVLQNVIVMASLSTLAFNLNPLMRFDGYYVLSDLLQIPNLSSQAGDIVRSSCRALLFGDSGSVPSPVGSRRRVLLVYGVAAFLWRILVSLSLLIAASVLFHGAGLALAALGVVCWFGRPLWKMLTGVWQLRLQHPERLIRAALVSVVASAVVAAGLFEMPAPVMTGAPGIVDYTNGEVVRAVTAGFVDAVHVQDGQTVSTGDLLITLRNDEVTSECSSLRKKLAQETLRLQTASRDHDGGAANIASGNLDSLKKQLDECQHQVDGLTLRAGRDGRVVGRELARLRGTYSKGGAELLTIGLENEKEMQLSIGQTDLSTSLTLIGEPLKVRIGTHPAVTGVLDRVNPQATRGIPHPALAAVNGGPLPVVENEKRESNSADAELRLTEHRFTAVVRFSADDARLLHCGERGFASLGLQRSSLGAHLWRTAHRWFDSQLSDDSAMR